jgi:hypothetical protein
MRLVGFYYKNTSGAICYSRFSVVNLYEYLSGNNDVTRIFALFSTFIEFITSESNAFQNTFID